MTRPHLASGNAGDSTWDAIVLGAGPAGAVAAYLLAAGGARTLLVDKKPFPRGKVCGACLNQGALAVLDSVGLGTLVARLGGVPLETLELHFSPSAARIALEGGMAVSRSRFDAALVEAAVASGADFLPETEGIVGALRRAVRQVFLVQRDRTVCACARVVLIATGLACARFEGTPLVQTHAVARSRVGAGCTVGDYPDFYAERIIFMAMGQGGYVGLVQVEKKGLNIASALDRGFIKECGSPGAAVDRLLAEAGFPALPALHDAPWQGTVPLTRRSWPIAGERFFLLGDATGYIEPFTGEGIAWALTSAQAVAGLARRGIDGWYPDLPAEWMSSHRRKIARRQWLCRGLAALGRHPPLARAAVDLVSRVPRVGALVVRSVNGLAVSRKRACT